MRRKPIHQDLRTTKVNDCLELLAAESIEAEVDQTIRPDQASKTEQRQARQYKQLLQASLKRRSASSELRNAIKDRVQKEALLRSKSR